MIGLIVGHLRTDADRKSLDKHLWKTAGQVPEVLETAHIEASTTAEAMAIMMMLRDSIPRARIGGWHIVISPRATLSPQQIRTVIDAVVAEFGAIGHPRIVWGHGGKQRAKAGGSDHHLHLVIGHVGRDLRALDMSFAVIRLERLMRMFEFDVGEPPTLGRHHGPVLRALKGQRADVAGWLEEAYGETPERPRARMTSGGRAAGARAGLNLPALIATIEQAWAEVRDRVDGTASLVERLSNSQLHIEGGHTAELIVRHANGTFVCALDRILPQDITDIVRSMPLARENPNAARPTDVRGSPPSTTVDIPQRGYDRNQSANERAQCDPGAGDAGRGDIGGDSGDSNQRRTVRSHPPDRNSAPGYRRTRPDVASHRGAVGADRGAVASALLTVLLQAGYADQQGRLMRRVRLVTVDGRIQERLRIAGRLQQWLSKIQGQRLDLMPETPVVYWDAREAVRQAQRALDEISQRETAPPELVPEQQRPRLLDRFRGKYLTSSPATHQSADVKAETPHEVNQHARRLAERTLKEAQRALRLIKTDYDRQVASTEAARTIRLRRLAHWTEVIETALHLLSGDDEWAVRGPLDLLRTAQLSVSRKDRDQDDSDIVTLADGSSMARLGTF